MSIPRRLVRVGAALRDATGGLPSPIVGSGGLLPDVASAGVLAATILLGACGADLGNEGRLASNAVVVTSAVVTTSPSTTPDPGALRVGQQRETTEGNAVKILAYEQPVPPGLLEPDPGMEFAAAEAEICAGRKGARRVTAESFNVEMADGSQRGRAFFGPKEPVFADGGLPPGACARGWVNFEVPKGSRPAYVVFRGSSVARWVTGRRVG